MAARQKLDYEAERRLVAQKFTVLRRAVIPGSDGLDFLAGMEAIAMRCLDQRLPKKVIGSIHSEMRVWVREGLFGTKGKKQLLAELAHVDEMRNDTTA